MDAGIISDSLMGLLGRNFFWNSYVCCKLMQNDQLGDAGVWRTCTRRKQMGWESLICGFFIVAKFSE